MYLCVYLANKLSERQIPVEYKKKSLNMGLNKAFKHMVVYLWFSKKNTLL